MNLDPFDRPDLGNSILFKNESIMDRSSGDSDLYKLI